MKDPLTESEAEVRSRAMRAVMTLMDSVHQAIDPEEKAALGRVMMAVYPPFCGALQAERLLDGQDSERVANRVIAATLLLITNQIWEVVRVLLPNSDVNIAAGLMVRRIEQLLASGPMDGGVATPSAH